MQETNQPHIQTQKPLQFTLRIPDMLDTTLTRTNKQSILQPMTPQSIPQSIVSDRDSRGGSIREFIDKLLMFGQENQVAGKGMGNFNGNMNTSSCDNTEITQFDPQLNSTGQLSQLRNSKNILSISIKSLGNQPNPNPNRSPIHQFQSLLMSIAENYQKSQLQTRNKVQQMQRNFIQTIEGLRIAYAKDVECYVSKINVYEQEIEILGKKLDLVRSQVRLKERKVQLLQKAISLKLLAQSAQNIDQNNSQYQIASQKPPNINLNQNQIINLLQKLKRSQQVTQKTQAQLLQEKKQTQLLNNRIEQHSHKLLLKQKQIDSITTQLQYYKKQYIEIQKKLQQQLRKNAELVIEVQNLHVQKNTIKQQQKTSNDEIHKKTLQKNRNLTKQVEQLQNSLFLKTKQISQLKLQQQQSHNVLTSQLEWYKQLLKQAKSNFVYNQLIKQERYKVLVEENSNYRTLLQKFQYERSNDNRSGLASTRGSLSRIVNKSINRSNSSGQIHHITHINLFNSKYKDKNSRNQQTTISQNQMVNNLIYNNNYNYDSVNVSRINQSVSQSINGNNIRQDEKNTEDIVNNSSDKQRQQQDRHKQDITYKNKLIKQQQQQQQQIKIPTYAKKQRKHKNANGNIKISISRNRLEVSQCRDGELCNTNIKYKKLSSKVAQKQIQKQNYRTENSTKNKSTNKSKQISYTSYTPHASYLQVPKQFLAEQKQHKIKSTRVSRDYTSTNHNDKNAFTMTMMKFKLDRATYAKDGEGLPGQYQNNVIVRNESDNALVGKQQRKNLTYR